MGTPADAHDPAGFKALSNWEIIKIIIINWHPDKWRDCLIGVVARELDLTWSLEGKRQWLAAVGRWGYRPCSSRAGSQDCISHICWQLPSAVADAVSARGVFLEGLQSGPFLSQAIEREALKSLGGKGKPPDASHRAPDPKTALASCSTTGSGTRRLPQTPFFLSPLCPLPHSAPPSERKLQSLAAPGWVSKTAGLSGHLPSNDMGACDSTVLGPLFSLPTSAGGESSLPSRSLWTRVRSSAPSAQHLHPR